jgi:hypothetical protein
MVAGGGCQKVDLVFDGEDFAVLGEQGEGRVAAGAVGDGAGGPGVDVAVLLAYLGTGRERDVDSARADVGQSCAEQ